MYKLITLGCVVLMLAACGTDSKQQQEDSKQATDTQNGRKAQQQVTAETTTAAKEETTGNKAVDEDSEGQVASTRDMLLKRWRYVLLETEQRTLGGDVVGQNFLELRGDSTFFGETPQQNTTGQWWLSNDTLYSVDSLFGQKQWLYVNTIKEDTLKLSGHDGVKAFSITLIPAS